MRRVLPSIVLAFGLVAGCEDVVPLQPLGAPPCTFGPEGGFCRDGHCEIVVPPGALAASTYVEITEVDAPPSLEVQAVASRLCSVGPDGLAFERSAELRIEYEPDEIAEGFDLNDLVGFSIRPQGVTRASATDAYPSFDRIGLPIDGAELAGATIVPSDIALESEIGRIELDVTDAASYLRNLSAFPFRGVFFDGQRLYLGNGSRVLVWTNGIPTDPLAPPDLILGKTDLTDDSGLTDAANIVGTVEDIWSDGERIVVSAGHRVLIWQRIPTENGAPADLVLGQETFNTNSANLGGIPSAQTLFSPDEIASDGERLLVADTSNHRVLVWTSFPRLFFTPADFVIGQTAFDRNMLRDGAIPLYQPRGVYLDDRRLLVSSSLGCTCAIGLNGTPTTNNPAADFTVGIENGVRRVTPTAFAFPAAMSAIGNGGLALKDAAGARVSIFNRFPSEPDTEPDVYVGKTDGDVGGTSITGVSASSLAGGASAHGGLFADENVLLVADETRVLVWDEIPSTSFEPADRVIGQPSFTTAARAIDYGGVGADALAHPRGIASSGGRRAIADQSNNRVVLLDGDATIVLGQADADGFLANRGGQPRADTLSAPADVAFDGERLIVVDSGNHRVLVWNSMPRTNGTPADVVLGHDRFDSAEANDGNADMDGDADRDASATSMFYPSSALVADGALFVSDAYNHRVLVFDPVPVRSGVPATTVLGQPSLEANDVNRGRGWFERAADTLALPAGLAHDGARLFVADRENNRVLAFDRAGASDDVADAVFGQPDFETDVDPSFNTAGNRGLPKSDAQLTATAMTLRRPTDVAVVGGVLFVADTTNHRVVGYETSGAAATLLFGQSSFEDRVADADGIGPASLEGPTGLAVDGTRLYVADTDNHRVLTFDRDAVRPDVRPEAFEVLGQIDMIGHGVNKSAQSPDLLANPTGVAFDGTRLWVADRDHHRVLAYGEKEPELVIGQVGFSRFLPNAGDEPTAATLASPTDVYVDSERLIVSDRHNHRVLIWSPPPTTSFEPADVVLGQRDFTSGEPNAGRGLDAPGADSMYSPEGVDFADGVLYVADTGNSRVLVFDGPLTTGKPASRVLCQATDRENLANRGRGAPAADTCAAPRDVTVVGDDLYVADTLNNRVLVFDRTGGTDARLVLGKPDATTRRSLEVTAASMSSPTSVAYDGSNLLVADAGNHRVLVFSLVPGASGAAADRVIGQLTFETGVPSPQRSGLVSPSRIALAPLAFNDTRVYVADTGRNRIAVFRGLSRLATSD